jgi:poly-D-alanine transfer protein DltD
VPSKRKVAVWNGARPSPLDAIRRREFASSEKGEWNDFALLLDTIKELQINSLIISMPISGAREDLEGILPATRHECYYARVESMCRERGVAVNTMESHDLDPDFLIDYVSHPSPVGWLHINRLLDDFWHDRFPPKT